MYPSIYNVPFVGFFFCTAGIFFRGPNAVISGWVDLDKKLMWGTLVSWDLDGCLQCGVIQCGDIIKLDCIHHSGWWLIIRRICLLITRTMSTIEVCLASFCPQTSEFSEAKAPIAWYTNLNNEISKAYTMLGNWALAIYKAE